MESAIVVVKMCVAVSSSEIDGQAIAGIQPEWLDYDPAKLDAVSIVT